MIGNYQNPTRCTSGDRMAQSAKSIRNGTHGDKGMVANVQPEAEKTGIAYVFREKFAAGPEYQALQREVLLQQVCTECAL